MKDMFVIGLMLISLNSFAQKTDQKKVPAIVTKAFSKFFPGASKPVWEREKRNYEAKFRQKEKNMSATFNDNGGWLETETEISLGSFPAQAQEYLAKNYNKQVIKNVSRIDLANGDERYEAEITGSDYIFDKKGKFLKKIKG
jgi:hypothetical protein